MKITKYRVELDDKKHNILVKESACDYQANETFNSPLTISTMLNEVFRLNKQAEEHVYMIAMNTSCNILGIFEVSHGTVNSSLCSPREIFIRALLCGASGIVIAHNHPSQNTTPSKLDLAIAKRMQEACELIGISLFDFLIIGKNYLSFRENDYI